jgi:hypothetical protein
VEVAVVNEKARLKLAVPVLNVHALVVHAPVVEVLRSLVMEDLY